jgi:GMP synthase (glutamine-hydrolysing)
MLDAQTAPTIEAEAGGRTIARDPMARAPGERKPALLVMHQETSNSGHVGQWLERNGYALDVRKPRFGDPLPDTLSGHCGAVIFGGPMSANDADEFIRREIQWIRVALEEKAPLLGICLGAQLMCVHLGAGVAFDPEERAEMGYYPIETTPEGHAVGPFPDHVYQWHREGCGLPSGARRLATSSGPFPNQAFAYGPAAVALQFHPEITYAQVHRWTSRRHSAPPIKGAQAREEHLSGHVAHAAKVQAWLDGFLARWVRAELPVR